MVMRALAGYSRAWRCLAVSISEELNDRQREAVITTDGPVLVIAGAGSGKTRVLTERIHYLVTERDVPAWNILAFTFTNKAAREMKDRLERSCPGVSRSLWVGTFHATGVRILRRHGEGVGVNRDFSIYDTDDTMAVLRSIMQGSILDGRLVKSPRTLRDRISRMKNELITPDLAADRAANQVDRRVAEMYVQYERELRRSNALDFDDLIVKVVELFAAAEEVKELYARRFRYVLVDEFQDTNPIQMAMIDGLASHHKNLFVVGDDDQSIYGWRGAKVEHILQFEDVYPGTRVIRLEQNYRSTKTILEAANHVIEHNVGRKGKTLWTAGEAGDRVKLLESMDEETEAVNVLHTVRSLLENGLNLRDIAILYRTNAQSRALEEVLKMGSLPYQIIGTVRFYERMEVRDVLAYCKILVNTADTVNLKRIINIPRRGIGKTSFERLEKASAELNSPIIELLRGGGHGLPAAAAKRCAGFMKTFDKLQSVVAKEAAPLVIEAILDEVNYRDYLKEGYPDSDARIENVEELVTAAHVFAEGAEDRSLRAFLEEVALVADVDALDPELGQLTLMTLHNAKGLEFDCVVITGLEEGLFPHFNSIDDAEQLEEERRLFYVGMTRARKHLFLSYANLRRRMGHIEGAQPSRFLLELPERCLDQTVGRPAQLTGGLFTRGDGASYRDGDTGWSHGLDAGDGVSQRQPDYESLSQDLPAGYEVGMRIRHESFGAGVVRKVEGKGEQTRVTVIFDSGGERKFLAHFAPMRPI
jgi:DNA helicase-2/ATP-dependent DNA helicase PcrA